MEILLYTTPLGLLLDIVGFILIIRFGHSLFLRAVSGSSPNRRDYIIYLEVPGNDDRKEGHRRLCAYAGVVAIITGFGLQAIGAMAALLG